MKVYDVSAQALINYKKIWHLVRLVRRRTGFFPWRFSCTVPQRQRGTSARSLWLTSGCVQKLAPNELRSLWLCFLLLFLVVTFVVDCSRAPGRVVRLMAVLEVNGQLWLRRRFKCQTHFVPFDDSDVQTSEHFPVKRLFYLFIMSKMSQWMSSVSVSISPAVSSLSHYFSSLLMERNTLITAVI